MTSKLFKQAQREFEECLKLVQESRAAADKSAYYAQECCRISKEAAWQWLETEKILANFKKLKREASNG
jgi:hypothetical protein